MGSMLRRIIAIEMAILAAMLLASRSQKETIRFRMTVEVQTPKGLRTGSSVMEISAWNNSFALNGHVRGRDFEGEAVPVILPDGRILVALIVAEREDYGEFSDIALDALDPFYRNDWVESVGRIENEKAPRLSRVLPPTRKAWNPAEPPVSNYPLLVSMQDANSPASVSPVNPADLEASFGPGYRIKAITFRVTDEPLTKEIGRKLPWLQAYWSKGLTLKPDPPDFSDGSIGDRIRHLDPGAFTSTAP